MVRAKKPPPVGYRVKYHCQEIGLSIFSIFQLYLTRPPFTEQISEKPWFYSEARNLNLKNFRLKSEILWYLHWNWASCQKCVYLVLAGLRDKNSLSFIPYCDVNLSLQSAHTLELKNFEYLIIICCVTLNQTFARLVGPYNWLVR